jgi:hypothetical protein
LVDRPNGAGSYAHPWRAFLVLALTIFLTTRAIGSLAGAAGLTVIFLWRSARHPVPIVELSMLRVCSFAHAMGRPGHSVAGFAALLVSNALFLTATWHFSAAGAAGDITTPRVAETRATLGWPRSLSRGWSRPLGGGEVGCRVVDRDLLSWEA